MEGPPVQALPNEETFVFSPDIKEIEIHCHWVAGNIVMESNVQQSTISESHVYGDGRCRIDVDGLNCNVTIRKLDTIVVDPTEQSK